MWWQWSGCIAVIPGLGEARVNAAFFRRFDYRNATVRSLIFNFKLIIVDACSLGAKIMSTHQNCISAQRVIRSKPDTFSSAPTSPRTWNLWLVRDDCSIQNEALAISIIVFGAHISILFMVKVNFLFLIKWSYRFPQLCWLLNLGWLTLVEHVVQSLLNTCLLVSILRSTPHHTPLKHRCPINRSIRIWAADVSTMFFYLLHFIFSDYSALHMAAQNSPKLKAHDKCPQFWLTCLPGTINCLSPRLSSRSKFGQMGTHEASIHLTRAKLWQAVCRCSLHLSGTYTWLQILANHFYLF